MTEAPGPTDLPQRGPRSVILVVFVASLLVGGVVAIARVRLPRFQARAALLEASALPSGTTIAADNGFQTSSSTACGHQVPPGIYDNMDAARSFDLPHESSIKQLRLHEGLRVFATDDEAKNALDGAIAIYSSCKGPWVASDGNQVTVTSGVGGGVPLHLGTESSTYTWLSTAGRYESADIIARHGQVVIVVYATRWGPSAGNDPAEVSELLRTYAPVALKHLDSTLSHAAPLPK